MTAPWRWFWLLMFVGFASSANAQFTLQSRQGSSAEVTIVAVTSSQVTFTRNAQKTTMKITDLTPDSAAALLQYAKAKGLYDSFPEIRVQVRVGVVNHRDQQIDYKKDMSIEPHASIAGATALEPIPAAEATMLIITMDTHAKYVSRLEKYTVKSTETLPVPAAANGASRDFDFKPQSTSYDAWRDSTNVGGAVYKYYIFGLRDAETKQIVYFDTNDPNLDKLIKTNPGQREKYLALAVGASFSDELK